jgi:hypothetical protein
VGQAILEMGDERNNIRMADQFETMQLGQEGCAQMNFNTRCFSIDFNHNSSPCRPIEARFHNCKDTDPQDILFKFL